jgi:hypothetical protein
MPGQRIDSPDPTFFYLEKMTATGSAEIADASMIGHFSLPNFSLSEKLNFFSPED